MNPASGPSIRVPSSVDHLHAIYSPIRAELEEAETLLRSALQNQHPFVDALVRHGFQLGGKRLRPALLLLSAKACGRLTEDHLRLAAAVEIIHTATLVHDDVLDDATTRRHMATINAKWSNDASILVGDFLFAQSLCLAGSVDDGFAIREIADACRRMCEGELRQVAHRGNLNLSETEYFEIIEAKTAALLRSSCRLGAHFAAADSDQIAALGRFGVELGMAFQIVDDILDVTGDEQLVGKSLGTDVVKQKMTLPTIRLLRQAEPDAAIEIRELLQTLDSVTDPRHAVEASSTLRRRLHESGSIEYAQGVAGEHVATARARLRSLAPSRARDGLEAIATFVLDRNV